MTEINTRPTLGDNVGWNTAGGGTETDPAAERANGWVYGQIPAHDEDNYMYARWGEMIQWIEANTPRRFDNLWEAIAAASINDLIRIQPNATGGMVGRGTSLVDTAGLGSAGSVQNVRCDGSLVFYTQGAAQDEIVAVAGNDCQDGAGGGTPVWTQTPSATNQVVCLACDGTYLWYVSNAANAGIWRRDAADGANPTNNGTTRYGHSRLRSNGNHVAGINGSPGVGYVDIWTAAGPTLVASNNTGSGGLGLIGLGIDQDLCYVGGIRNTNDVWAYGLVGGGLAWSATLDTNAPQVNAICCDGDFVYVGTNDFATAAGPNKNLFCIERTNGALVWSYRVGTIDIANLETDGRYLYCHDTAGNQVFMVDPRAPGSVDYVIGAVGDDIDVDGCRMYCQNSGTTGNVFALNVMDGPALFWLPNQAVNPDLRRPYYKHHMPA